MYGARILGIEPLTQNSCSVVVKTILEDTKTKVLQVSAKDVWNWYYGVDQRLIQDQFPSLTEDEREFLMTGLSGDEWPDGGE